MPESINSQRRLILGGAAVAAIAAELGFTGSARAATTTVAKTTVVGGRPQATLAPIRQIRAGELDAGYYEAGPADGVPVLLLHGYPYDIHSYAEAAALLAAQGCRVIVPHLRGHGTTRFLDASTPRSGQQTAVAMDAIALLDALAIDRAVVAGFDWGARTACILAALWPQRCIGLVSVGGYVMTNLPANLHPLPAKAEHAWWYQYYFATERGREGLAANRAEIARILWTTNSPRWAFEEADFERTAASFDNPDYVNIVISNYRWRLGLEPSDPRYAPWEKQAAALPVITIPTITMDGSENGITPTTDGKAQSGKFSGARTHLIVDAGHNLPQEAPRAFADAVWTLASAQRKVAGRNTIGAA
jgi:pimeloyl-ACP methyl ester carboxylesterase